MIVITIITLIVLISLYRVIKKLNKDMNSIKDIEEKLNQYYIERERRLIERNK